MDWARLRLLRLHLRLALWRWLRPPESHTALLWAGLVGLLGGLSSLAFRLAAQSLKWLLTRQPGELEETARALPDWMRVAVPAGGALLAGLTLQLHQRVLKRVAASDYMEAVVLGDGVVRARSTLVRSVSALFTIASGGSIGREGPMVQLAAMLGSLAARARGLPLPRRRLLVACGAAAGIASAYNAPIAGALFVSEIVLGSIAMESFGPLVISSVVATLTTRYVLGPAPVYQAPRFELGSSQELAACLALGLLAGALAPAFLALLRTAERGFSRALRPVWLRVFAGGLIVGLISLRAPEVWGNGYGVVNSLLNVDWTWRAALALLAWKVAATASTVGSGAVGGVFTPTLFVGAALGTLLGTAVHALWPAVTAPPQAYALLGMGCFLAATTHAPLMAILIVFELTLDYGVVLPLSLGCVAAYYAASGLDRRSLYTLRRIGQSPTELVARGPIRVAQLLHPEPVHVAGDASATSIVDAFARSQQLFLFVVGDDGRFHGAISLASFTKVLRDDERRRTVSARELVDDTFPVIVPGDPIEVALERLAEHPGRRLAVVDDPTHRRFLGCVSRSDVLLAIAHGIGEGHAADAPPG